MNLLVVFFLVFLESVYRPSNKSRQSGEAGHSITPGTHNLDPRDERDKAISTRAYAFNGLHLDYYVSSNYRWQIYHAEIKLSGGGAFRFSLLL